MVGAVRAGAVDMPGEHGPFTVRAEGINADHAGAAPAMARICLREIMKDLLCMRVALEGEPIPQVTFTQSLLDGGIDIDDMIS
jgi:hypothetical protein